MPITARLALERFLANKQLKLTPQRVSILDAFLESEGHVSSEELYDLIKQDDPSIGQATVYRTMKLLVDAGLARSVDLGDGTVRYEQKLGHEHHDHLVCNRCGVHVEFVDTVIEELQEDLAKRHGFRLSGHRMILYGFCADCNKE
ncbi:MAG: Fur family transcriptional regulator [bacterium]